MNRRGRPFTPAETEQVQAWRANGVTWHRITKTLGVSEDKLRRVFDPGFAERRDEAARIRRAKGDLGEERRALKARLEREAAGRAAAAAAEPVPTPAAHIIALHTRGVRLTGIAALVRQPYRVVSEVIERHRRAVLPDLGGDKSLLRIGSVSPRAGEQPHITHSRPAGIGSMA